VTLSLSKHLDNMLFHASTRTVYVYNNVSRCAAWDHTGRCSHPWSNQRRV